MITFLSLVTSVKDYVEIVHKLIESDTNFKITNYEELGSILTYIVITLKEFIFQIITLKWLNNLWDLPIIIPDISSAMVSEFSILDGYFHNAFNFLDKPLPYGETNILLLNLEKFSIGLINSLFLFIPTGTSHLITIRRFVMQGLEAGYLAGLGSIFGNILWITSVIFGFRFFVIPWVSLDIFRYILGFILLVKYMWDSSNEKKMTITSEPAKQKIFILNFLLALTEQTSIYPFLTNLSIGSESSIFESFPAQNLSSFLSIHCSYIFGLTLGCLSLLQFTCWFWENPAFQIYMWLISSFKVSTTVYYKVLNFTFLYLTMICAISSIPYYGLDYTLTNPLGLVQDDRILYQTETLMKAPNLSFLGTKASDRNTRRNRGRHGRRERWKRRIRKYRTFDASLYDQGVYDLFTIEDLNYGFDRFWLRRKMRNHRVRFRFFPGSWMRSFKKQLAKPRLESYAGPRQEFFRILFEQIYHPSFHVYSTGSSQGTNLSFSGGETSNKLSSGQANTGQDIISKSTLDKNSLSLMTASKMALNKNRSFFLKNDANSDIGLSELSLVNQIDRGYNSNQQSPFLIKDSSIYSTKLVKKQNQEAVGNIDNLSSNKNFDNREGPAAFRRSKDDTFALNSNAVKGKEGFLKLPGVTLNNSLNNTLQKSQQTNIGILETQSFTTASSIRENLKVENSTLRKFVRKLDTRLKMSQIKENFKHQSFNSFLNPPYYEGFALSGNADTSSLLGQNRITSIPKLEKSKRVYSKRWKHIFSKINHFVGLPADNSLTKNKNFFRNFYGTFLTTNLEGQNRLKAFFNPQSVKKQNSQISFGDMRSGVVNKDLQILKYRSLYLNNKDAFNETTSNLQHQLKNKQSVPLTAKLLGDKVEDQSLYNVPLFSKKSTPFTLFHSLNFYQKKQQAFEKKLHYYTPTVFRKFSIENNAPYFRVMMKRYFYYYKPTLRWERTMKVASLRKARRKTSTNPRKIQLSRSSGDTGLEPNKNDSSTGFLSFNNWDNRKASLVSFNKATRKTIPTHNYTIVGKRASRYRYQIYKDVLQHWYYTPFNRLLLKFDIDLFINRQPKSHFLTKNEENLLHLRRFFLSEHYNSLRWYTQMEHYRSMKTNIGGTKSFVSGIYNQQFSGTFKKIRHLFAITPSQTNQSVLKFDQPLYNEYFNNTKNSNQKNLIIHEELLTNRINPDISGVVSQLTSSNNGVTGNPQVMGAYNLGALSSNDLKSIQNAEQSASKLTSSTLKQPLTQGTYNTTLPKDLVNQSTQILGNYLIKTKPIKQEYIKKLLEQKNYVELTNFLYKGQKNRGFKPVTNYSALLNQEKDYLFTNKEVTAFKDFEKTKIKNYLQNTFPNDLWVNLLKKWKRKVNDQEFLKNYLQRRVEKREKRKSKKQKNIQLKLQRLETIGLYNKTKSLIDVSPSKNYKKSKAFLKESPTVTPSLFCSQKESCSGQMQPFSENQITTGVQKSLNEGLKTLNITNNNKNYLQNESTGNMTYIMSNSSFEDLKNQLYLNQKSELLDSLNLLSKLVTSVDKTSYKGNKLLKTKKFKDFSYKIFLIPATKIKNFYKNYQSKVNKVFKTRVLKIFTKAKDRSINFKAWQEKERTLNKQKRIRKEFKPLSKKPFNFDPKNFSKYIDQKTDIPLPIILDTSLNKKINSKNFESAQDFILQREFIKRKIQHKALRQSVSSQSTFDDNLTTPIRKKLDYSTIIIGDVATLTNSDSKKVQDFEQTKENLGWDKKLKNTYLKYFQRKFKRKKSPQRRVRVRKNRAVIKKRTLSDSLKREFQKLKIYNQTLQMDKEQLAAFSLTSRALESQDSFKTGLKPLTAELLGAKSEAFLFRPTLQRRAKQKKQRFWKQKRSKYSQKSRKYKKRRRSVLGKIRILNKQLKKVKITNDLKFWWWNNFLQNLRATTDSLWQYEKDRQIEQKLLELSIPEFSEQSKLNYQIASSKELSSVPIGIFDYKPFAIGENALLVKSTSKLDTLATNNTEKFQPNNEQNDMVSRVAENYLLSRRSEEQRSSFNETTSDNRFYPVTKQQTGKVLTNPIPFYAGWDESLRKFVVTNRLLSRRESGYEMNLPIDYNGRFMLQQANNTEREAYSKLHSKNENNKSLDSVNTYQRNNSNFSFTSAPLKGMNTATTLYWQIPFTTYDPDQFFALGMDGFAPLGWKRFQFRHSILKSWLYEKSTSKNNKNDLYRNKSNNNLLLSGEALGTDLPNMGEAQDEGSYPNKKLAVLSNTYVVKNKMSLYTNLSSDNLKIKSTNLLNKLKDKNGLHSPITIFTSSNTVEQNPQLKHFNKNTRNIYRRLKKRYRRVKKHPRSPVWFPSGPLLNQVLPVHYIYIFYKRSRLPRDRYIKRRLVKSKAQINLFSQEQNSSSVYTTNTNKNFYPSVDFTLRKRVKTKRKYHIKQDVTKQSTLIPRRVKFIIEDKAPYNHINNMGVVPEGQSPILRWRPISRQKLNKPVTDLIKEKSVLRSKQKKKELQELNSKQPTNIRIKQLRRRVQRQIIRSVWRYKPRAGGFVWPGDYLKLELIKAPKLDLQISSLSTEPQTRIASTKVKRKKKRNIQEWQIQPKKYLLQKHNYNVIKKKLVKAQRSNKIPERMKELTMLYP